MNDGCKAIPGRPADERDVVRDSCVRVGQCERLASSDVVWTDYCGRWCKARVRRALPGGVYMAELITYPGNGTLVTVSAASYGGKIAAK